MNYASSLRLAKVVGYFVVKQGAYIIDFYFNIG